MSSTQAKPARYIGLDVHKHYLVAAGVDGGQNEILGPCRVPLTDTERWADAHLTQQDAVVLEMSTNSFQVHDDLLPFVQSVVLIHPPHAALITRAQGYLPYALVRCSCPLKGPRFPQTKRSTSKSLEMDLLMPRSLEAPHSESPIPSTSSRILMMGFSHHTGISFEFAISYFTGPNSRRVIPSSRITARTVPGARSLPPQSGIEATRSVVGLCQIRWLPCRRAIPYSPTCVIVG